MRIFSQKYEPINDVKLVNTLVDELNHILHNEVAGLSVDEFVTKRPDGAYVLDVAYADPIEGDVIVYDGGIHVKIDTAVVVIYDNETTLFQALKDPDEPDDFEKTLVGLLAPKLVENIEDEFTNYQMEMGL